MSFAFLFAGQGSQSLNMMDGLNDFPIVKQTFDEASDALNINLWDMIHGNDSDIIAQTINTQPIMLAAGVATYRAYLAAGGKAPSAVAGHSLGEYSALVVAGSLDFSDAIKLVRLRAQFMQDAVPQGVGAMAAILGLDVETVRQICLQAEQNQNQNNDVAEAVNLNSPEQTVIAGNTQAIERAMNLAKEAGAKRALLLPVSVPSHCRLMKPAAEQLGEKLNEVTFKEPQIRVIHNADVASYTQADDIKNALVKQLYSPVRWTETIDLLCREGITNFAECTPNKVLAGLTKRINKEATCASLISRATIEEFIQNNQ